jgi:hypothetical protein
MVRNTCCVIDCTSIPIIHTHNGDGTFQNKEETEVLAEYLLSACHFFLHKSRMEWPGIKAGSPHLAITKNI